MAPHFRGYLPQRHETTWGPWSISLDRCLVNTNNGYEIDLEEIKNTADLMNWLMHMTTKNEKLYGENFMYYLAKAFADILQYSKINTAKNCEFNGYKIASKYVKSLQPKRYVSPRVRHQVLERDGFTCCDCGASRMTGAVLEIDHTIPVSKGGSNEISNLRTLCVTCNRGKSDRLVNYPDAFFRL